MRKLSFVILAGGRGVRMNSDIPKPLRILSGKSMLERVIESARTLTEERVIVVSGDIRVEKEALRLGCLVAKQEEPLGTGDALKKALPYCFEEGEVMVSCADTPLIPPDVFRKVYSTNVREGSYITLLTSRAPDPSGYGRVIRDNGRPVRIIEEKEAGSEEKKIDTVNSGIYCIKRSGLEKMLDKLEKSPVKGEYYLTDLIGIAVKEGEKISEAGCPWVFVQGVNTPAQLEQAEEYLRKITEG